MEKLHFTVREQACVLFAWFLLSSNSLLAADAVPLALTESIDFEEREHRLVSGERAITLLREKSRMVLTIDKQTVWKLPAPLVITDVALSNSRNLVLLQVWSKGKTEFPA